MGSWSLSASSQVHVAVVSQTLSFLFFLSFSNGALGVTFTIVNDCGFTIWPAIVSDPTLNETGFELTKGNSRSFQAPAMWNAYIWGRTGCKFNSSGNWSCATGDCRTNKMECNLNETSIPPATSANLMINLNQTHRQDYYQAYIAEGYNLPILVEATGGSGSSLHSCAKTGCVEDLNQRCPTELTTSGGEACMSACTAFRSPEYCCTYSFSSPSSCKPTAYDQLFRSACPRSYTYSTLSDIQTSTFTCNDADYTIKFCAPADSFSTIKRGGQLKSTDQLVSMRGNFTLGFFGEDYSYWEFGTQAIFNPRKYGSLIQMHRSNPPQALIPSPSVPKLET